jgi:hypothetical protein
MLYAADVTQEVRESEVNQQLSLLKGNLETLKHQIGQAREKLRPVMNESRGIGNDQQKGPEPVLCPLATEIRVIALEIDGMCDAFAHVLRSVEV